MATANVSQDESISKFVLRGSQFSYDRLAEDVLNLLFVMFKVEKRLIPIPRLAKNSYSHPSSIHQIARRSRLDQIMYRGVWYADFIKNDAALRTENDITKLYEFVTVCIQEFAFTFHEMKHTPGFKDTNRECNPILLFHVSFAFIAELALFFIMKKNKSVIKKMSRVWGMYFSKELKEDFEAAGGLNRVQQENPKPNMLDDFATKFVQDHCIPYTGVPVHEKFLALLNNDTLEKYRVKHAKSKIEGRGVQTGHPSNPDPLQALKVHERLGLVPHEDVLKKCADVKPLPQQEETPPEDTDDSTAKAIRALSLQAERKKAKKRLQERNPFPITKTQLHHHEDKETAANASTTSLETTEEPETGHSDSQHEHNQEDSQSHTESDTTGIDYSGQGARPRTRKF